MLLEPAELQQLQDEMLGYEIRFCEEYMVDFNPTKALERTQVATGRGIDKKALLSTIMQKDTVIKYLAHLKAVMGIETNVTATRVLKEIAAIAFQDIRQFIRMQDGEVSFRDLDDMSNTAAISSIELASMGGDFKEMGKVLKMKTYDKLKALEMLGRHVALFTDNVNLTNNGGDMPPAVINKIVINHRKPGEELQ